jgi:C-terminal processing protease CtpA/Prc
VWVSDGGRLSIVPVAGGAARPVAITAELDTDFHADKIVAFEQAWATQRDQFYDPAMHGVDWNGVRERFAPYVRAAQTPDELRRLLQLMVGELNASHSGASGPSGFATAPAGKLGLRFDRTAYEQDGTLRVREVIALGPAAVAGVAVGDRLVAVNGQPLSRTDNLDARLLNMVGRRVELTVATGATERQVAVRPVTTNTEKGLLYRQWVNERRAYVARVSNGRLGYVHMNDMSAEALDQLHLDLDAENFGRNGVVIDLRNNNGGFVNAYALDVFTRRGYMTMTTRGSVAVPARTQLGQRALEKPTVLVVNQHTLSDGEDFTEGYRNLGLGPVVGEPTAGWIIYTSNVTLVDGTSLRVPFIKVEGADGRNMELVPRPVDVPVTRPVGESYAGSDQQLDAAVRALLDRLGR